MRFDRLLSPTETGKDDGGATMNAVVDGAVGVFFTSNNLQFMYII